MGKVSVSNKQRILIADDSEINRSILADMLGDGYEIIEAETGVEVISILREYDNHIDLLLLDVVMPQMDGFEVLILMNRYHMIEEVPVIMISAESASSYMERAYELGVTDYISRPFDAMIVRRRVLNTLVLYGKQKKLVRMVADQIYEKEKNSRMLINILSHIVEFRNGESGMHVLHIHTMTELFLRRLIQKTDKYNLEQQDISIISTASALHDIGKIAIPSEVLNKPGRLTEEEFTIMKTHSMIGAAMLEKLPIYQDEKLVTVAYQICRWHHERFDGTGYPDGLKGEESPIAAQIVAIADVYDALTSERVYKRAFSHGKAMDMILNGECGVFNPLLLECLVEIGDVIQKELKISSVERYNHQALQNISSELMKHEELSASERTLQLLEHERAKYHFFASMSKEIQFEYSENPPLLKISDWGAAKLGVSNVAMNPYKDEEICSVIGVENIRNIDAMVRNTTVENPIAQCECEIMLNGSPHWYRFICRAIWSSEEIPRYQGMIGKMTNIHEEYSNMLKLQEKASLDALTGLLNHVNAKLQIIKRFQDRPNEKYALIIFDLDDFKRINDEHGHKYGDAVLQYTADRLRKSVRENDIIARAGGDEFLIFFSYQDHLETIVQRIFTSLTDVSDDRSVSVSMGIATTAIAGLDYDKLFHRTDQALYAAKRKGRGQYQFYNDAMKGILSMVSAIDSVEEEKRTNKEDRYDFKRVL